MKISHIAVWVKDLESIKNFYIKYFNCKCNDKYINEKKGFESYFLTFEDNCRLEIMTRKDIKNRNTNDDIYGFAHIAVSVGSKEKVDSLTKELESDGFKIASYPRTTGDGYYESVILDNENNKIEITI
ncbi:hypothetical protein BFL38_08430 [Brachyspira hampsonii]|uniref:VOC domain-containing protein n=1 Tax=Brachyspira hampsonii TaxID=1287055 RepID=A0A1E5NFA8_9SPIR|nr:VOC family protein [Brachyspira hampsonii]OEJ14852.1 hypothetical protein BFL38_08430 [Brachyspira hampsonii]